MHYQTKFKANFKPQATRKAVLVKDYSALMAEYSKLLEIHMKHECPKCEKCKECTCEEMTTELVKVKAANEKRRKQDAKLNTALRNTISSLKKDKVQLHDQAFEAMGSVKEHENQVRIFADSNNTLKLTNAKLAATIAKLKVTVETQATEAEKLEAELQGIEDSKFTFAKFGKAIASPFVAAFNKIKTLWS